MVDTAMKSGINYYDTAWGYHGENSELVMGKALARYPRESFYLATKFPGYDPANWSKVEEIFEAQLKKLNTTYFDFYLFHNVCEMNIDAYLDDERYHIFSYLMEQKRNGRIKHLGFSCHGSIPVLRRFLEAYGKDMEFCQLQLNYLDWTVQKGKEKYDLVTSYGLPIIVMEPVRGGKLAKLCQGTLDELNKDRPDASAASYALRWFQPLENVFTVLSGMSDMEQTVDNIATFDHEDPLSEKEEQLIMNAAEAMKSEVPCTACRYCVDSCPMELDIPDLLFKYNQIRAESGFTIKMQLDAYPEDKQPSACIGCGACMEMCPQKIQIPDELKAFTEALEKIPSWVDICRERAEAEKKMEEANK
jgi:predicted aldo/keto reductase-like oxidoreductase